MAYMVSKGNLASAGCWRWQVFSKRDNRAGCCRSCCKEAIEDRGWCRGKAQPRELVLCATHQYFGGNSCRYMD